MARDIQGYTEQYLQLPFETIQAAYRRRLVLSRIAHHRPRRLLEIGCGRIPLFTDLPDTAVTVIEPSPTFAEVARQLATERRDVRVLQAYAEDVDPEAEGMDVEMVVLSCLLHEVDDAQALLAAVHRLCGTDTVVHVNVPNALSLHRLLAVSMGLLAAPEAPSDTQRRMQQRTVYNGKTLQAELALAGFEITDQGGLFVKPFSHAQMQQLVDQGFMTTPMLDGLAHLVEVLPDLGSEIWADAKLGTKNEYA
jgi:SAM-dependent methyltransferase